MPTLVIAEVSHFVPRMGIDAELSFLADLAEGALEPVPVDPIDWPRIIELTWRYQDLPLGTVDASVVALAERLRITQIATLDRKHFSVVKPLHADAFELLP